MKRSTKVGRSKTAPSRGARVAPVAKPAVTQLEPDATVLVREVGAMIDAARQKVSLAANAALTGLYWQIGRRVDAEVLDERRATYGAQIVSAAGRHWRRATGAGSASGAYAI